MSWWFIVCIGHIAIRTLFKPSTSLSTINGDGPQCSFLFSI
uniref:Uncharacterized protein n=1 Tax=Rhizophora mucronata TaxID=61149 RepID=A0A2P2P581_RHIMU